MKNTIIARYKVETVHGHRFYLKLVKLDNWLYQFYCRTGFWFAPYWEPIGNAFPELVFIPAVIARHFGYTAKYWKLK